MSQFRTIRRVTVYADASLEKILLERFLHLGATGYSIVECRGQGEHEVVVDPFRGAARVRIEVLCRPEVGEKILDYLSGENFQRRAVAACMEHVEVASGDKF
ncbi:P-II family nitrogen regulator [Tundrisphaera lichenicola]|uniref:P-II family nitrogen regulator n=1 Tax=Tundrisphaera lichenicola TaxID=2029860 RepID=UPI003EBCA641